MNFVPISNGESGSSVRNKLNTFLAGIPTEFESLGGSINRVASDLSVLQATHSSDVSRLESGITEVSSNLDSEVTRLIGMIQLVADTDIIVSAIVSTDAANDFPIEKIAVVIAFCTGQLDNFYASSTTKVSISGEFPYVILLKVANDRYWSVVNPSFSLTSLIDDTSAVATRTWSSQKIASEITARPLFVMQGRVDSYEDLANIENPQPGWVYSVGEALDPDKVEYVYANSGNWEFLGTRMTIDDHFDADSDNPVANSVITQKIQDIETALNSKQGTLLIDNEPTQDSPNSMTSGGIFDAFASYIPPRPLPYVLDSITNTLSKTFVTITKESHECGANPDVRCFVKNSSNVWERAYFNIEISNTGDVTIRWKNASDISANNPLKVVIS